MTEETFEITIEGVSSSARNGLLLALGDVKADISAKTDVTIGNLTEERAETLLDALLEVEDELSGYGSYDEAQAVDRLRSEFERELWGDQL